MRRFVEEGWVNMVGGCCGTTPAHTRALARLVEGRAPRRPAPARAPVVSGIEALYPSDDNRRVIVGERANVIGSRRSNELVVEQKCEAAPEVGRAQLPGGTQAPNASPAKPGRDERTDMQRITTAVTRKGNAPLMIDSTDAVVTETALRHCQGKAIVNSI